MDKKGKSNGMGLVGKIFLIVALVLALFGGFNALLVGITRLDLFGRIFLYFPEIFTILTVRIAYTLTALATLVVSIWFFIKVIIKGE